MTWEEFRKEALPRAVYPRDPQIAKDYVTLGLLSEAGEVAGVVKRILRGDYTHEEARPKVIKELGDVCWYIAACEREHFGDDFELRPPSMVNYQTDAPLPLKVLFLTRSASRFDETHGAVYLRHLLAWVTAVAEEFEATLSDVLEANTAKLKDRAERGVTRGEGDDR